MNFEKKSPIGVIIGGAAISLVLIFGYLGYRWVTGDHEFAISSVKSPGLGFQLDGSCSGNAANPSPEQVFVNGMGMKFVRLPDLEIGFGIHEVTREQFRFYAESTGMKDLRWLNRITRAGLSQDENHPVVNVSWEEATRFCGWLTKQEGKVFRLPTDYEWSVAAGLAPETSYLSPGQRGEKAPREFFWGSDWQTDKAPENYADKAYESITGSPDCFPFDDRFPVTAPVGSFLPNRFGIYDLGGNVCEWVYDWYQSKEEFKTVRGASYGTGMAQKEYHYKGFRGMSEPTFCSEFVGFRVVAETSENLHPVTLTAAEPTIPPPTEAAPSYDATPAPAELNIASYPAFEPVVTGTSIPDPVANMEIPTELPPVQGKPIRVTYSGKDGINVRETQTFGSGNILGAILKQSSIPLMQIGDDRKVDTETWVNVEVKGWIPTKNSTHTYLEDQGNGTWKVVWDKPGDRFVSMRSNTSSEDTLISKVFTDTVVEEIDQKEEGGSHYIYGKFSGWVVKENVSRSYISDIK